MSRRPAAIIAPVSCVSLQNCRRRRTCPDTKQHHGKIKQFGFSGIVIGRIGIKKGGLVCFPALSRTINRIPVPSSERDRPSGRESPEDKWSTGTPCQPEDRSQTTLPSAFDKDSHRASKFQLQTIITHIRIIFSVNFNPLPVNPAQTLLLKQELHEQDTRLFSAFPAGFGRIPQLKDCFPN